MHIIDIIKKKRDGGKLTKDEIEFFVKGVTDGSIPDYQASSLLMAIYLNGMDIEETTFLTIAMAESGDMLDLSAINGTVIDKHSTGGVGDKTTLIIGPILAALGVHTAKMSGRGLGHTGGTVDKLESIPGFRSDLSEEEFINTVNTVGFSDISQTKSLAPADKILYALRDVTGTVENYSLIASSIMSKKLAAGADGIVLDVKTGNGAFMKDEDSSEKLAKVMVDIGNNAGRKTVALITDMNEPLGRYVGNTLEVMEAIEVLKGRGEERLTEVSKALAVEMLKVAGVSDSEKASADVERVIKDGAALQKFRDFVSAQGGNSDITEDLSLLGEAKYKVDVYLTDSTDKEGCVMSDDNINGVYISACDTEKIGLAVTALGGGREKLDDVIDPVVGIEIRKRIGETISKDEPIAVIYANNKEKAEEAAGIVKSAYTISLEKPVTREPIIKRIS